MFGSGECLVSTFYGFGANLILVNVVKQLSKIHYSEASVNTLRKELENLPVKVANSPLMALVIRLLPQIKKMEEKGYTLTDIHQRLESNQIECSYANFRRCVRIAQSNEERQAESEITVVDDSLEERIEELEIEDSENAFVIQSTKKAQTKAAQAKTEKSETTAADKNNGQVKHKKTAASNRTNNRKTEHSTQKGTSKIKPLNSQAVPVAAADSGTGPPLSPEELMKQFLAAPNPDSVHFNRY
jgi:DNA-binding transcriptional MerR regulator